MVSYAHLIAVSRSPLPILIHLSKFPFSLIFFLSLSLRPRMRVLVTVKNQTFQVPVGEGGQTLKWLSLVAAQQYSIRKPQGRSRYREKKGDEEGFFLPMGMSSGGTGLRDPDAIINEVFDDGAAVTVELQEVVEVDSINAPVQSEWQQKSFNYGESSKLRMKAEGERREEERKEEAGKNKKEREERNRERLEMSAGASASVQVSRTWQLCSCSCSCLSASAVFFRLERTNATLNLFFFSSSLLFSSFLRLGVRHRRRHRLRRLVHDRLVLAQLLLHTGPVGAPGLLSPDLPRSLRHFLPLRWPAQEGRRGRKHRRHHFRRVLTLPSHRPPRARVQRHQKDQGVHRHHEA